MLNAPPSSPTEDIEVGLKIIPVDLRLIELQRKESYKILLKEQDDPTRLLIENSLSPQNSRVSPGYHLQRLSKTTYKFLQSRYGDNSPEEIAKPLKHYERPNILCHNLGENWGNATNRTEIQKQDASLQSIDSWKTWKIFLT